MKEVLHRGFCAHFAKNPVAIKQDDLAELLFLVLVLNHGANEVKFVRTFFVFLFELSSKYMEGEMCMISTSLYAFGGTKSGT